MNFWGIFNFLLFLTYTPLHNLLIIVGQIPRNRIVGLKGTQLNFDNKPFL